MKQINLLYFTKAAEEKSITKAAEKLSISQPALSKSIKAIEKELGVILFNRSPKELTLTKEGNLFYDYAVDVLSYWESRTNDIREQLLRETKIIRFGLPPSAGNLYFSRKIFDFTQKYPDIEFQFVESNCKEIESLLLSGDLDIGVVVDPWKRPELTYKHVYRSEAALAVSWEHPFAGRESIDFQELRDQPFLSVTPEYYFYDLVLSKFREAGFAPKISFSSSHWDVLLEMAAENQGITIIGKQLAKKMYGERVSLIRLEHPDFPWGFSLARRKDRSPSEAIQYFFDLCIPQDHRS